MLRFFLEIAQRHIARVTKKRGGEHVSLTKKERGDRTTFSQDSHTVSAHNCSNRNKAWLSTKQRIDDQTMFLGYRWEVVRS